MKSTAPTGERVPPKPQSPAATELPHDRLRMTQAAAGIGTWEWEPDTGFSQLSPELQEMFGTDTSDPRHLELWRSRIFPDDLQNVLAQIAAGGESGSVDFEYRYLHSTRGLRWFHCKGRRIESGLRRLFGVVVDITDRKQAEAALQESEQQFRTIADSIPQLAWMASPDGWIYWYNRRWYEYTGTTPDKMQGWGWQSVHDPAELPRVLARWRTALAEGKDWEDTFPLKSRSGEFRWFLSRAIPIRDSSGRVSHWFGTNTDIHEQRRAELALRQSEERLRAALAASGTGIFRWDPHTGQLLDFDDNLRRLFGFDPQEIAPTLQRFLERVHPADLPAIQAALERSRDGADSEVECRIVLPDGSIRWIYERGKMVHEDGRPAYMVGACSDITTRKQAEESRRHMAAVVESSDDAIITKDLNGIITSWNAGAERIFGWTAAEAVGKSILLIIPPELHPDETMILGKLVRGERIDHFETVRVTKSGERRELALTISPVRDETGRVIGASKIARDITSRKRAEEALRMSEKLASAGRMAATIAHEINNPLEAVINLIYLAATDPSLSPQTRKHLQQADEELGRIAHIARQTLGFYRESTAPEPTRLADLFQSLALVYGARLRQKKIRLDLDLEYGLQARGVRGELRQVMANILQNSIEAVPVGGVIVVRATPARHWPSQRRGVRITIADSGGGIPRQQRTRIFDPFFTTKPQVGTGLGLWVAKEIIEHHGGAIRLRSNTTPGKSWTAVSVFLPGEPVRNGPARKQQVA